jgi:hypothetical protein
VERESIRRVKVLGFMSLWVFCFTCTLQAWRKVDANGEGWQQQKCAFFAYREERES